MTNKGLSKKSLAILFTVLLLISLISIILASVSYEEDACYAAGDIEVVIELRPDYQLVYKADNFLVEDNGFFHPDSDLFSALVITEKTSGNTVEDLVPSDINVSGQALPLRDAGVYNDLVFEIADTNSTYFGQSIIDLEIQKAPLFIDSADAEEYFDYSDTKIYDTTTAFDSITVINDAIEAINDEIAYIVDVYAEYSAPNAGNAEYAITFEVDSDNYLPQPIIMTGQILPYEIDDAEAERFIGIKHYKLYDTTHDMTLYDRVIYIKEELVEVFNYLADKIADTYFLPRNNGETIVQSLLIGVNNPQEDDYTILRIDNDKLLYLIYSFDQNNPFGARDICDDLLSQLENWLISQDYDHIVYTGDDVADLYFTNLNELISLSDVYGEFASADSQEGLPYTIYFNDEDLSNYVFSSYQTQGVNGTITPVILGVIFPTIEIYYGDSLPTQYKIPFVKEDDLSEVIGESVYSEENKLFLPIPAFIFSFDYINSVLNQFYAADLLKPEYASMLDEDGDILMDFDFDDEVEYNGNVYDSLENAGGPPTRYMLDMPSILTNYIFIDVIYLFDSQDRFYGPNLMVKPKTLEVDMFEASTQKRYDNSSDSFGLAICDGFLSGEENLFYAFISYNFMDYEGNYVVNAGNNYLLSHFELGLLPKEGVVGYTEEELLLMCYNYDISKYSFALAARQEYSGVLSVEVCVEDASSWIWVDLSSYESQYLGQPILDIRLMCLSGFEDTIKIEKAELIISVIENQYLAYGNDIMRQIAFDFQNFYQSDPWDIFTLSYILKDGESVIYDTPNDQATPLIPRENGYKIILDGFSARSEWLNEYGNNYDIILDSTEIDFYVVKGLLYDIQISHLTKDYGDFDPLFTFDLIKGHRDCDYYDLQERLLRASAIENAKNTIEIYLDDSHEYYDIDYSTYSVGSLYINTRTENIEPDQYIITYGEISDTYFTINVDYAVPTEVFGDITLNLTYYCFAETLNAGEEFIHDIYDIQYRIPNYNIDIVLINGDNKIKIKPKEVEINLSATDGLNNAYNGLQKAYDGLPLIINLKDDYTFDYNNDFIDLEDEDYPIPREDRFALGYYVYLDDLLEYGERLFFAKIEANIYDSYYERTKYGEKTLYLTNIVLAKIDGFDQYLVSADNYAFTLVYDKAEITKKEIYLNTAPQGQTYSKVFDNQNFVLPFTPNMYGAGDLAAGHYFDLSSLYFISEGKDVGVWNLLMQSESGFKIYDESEMDVSENYEIANEDFGNVTITEREVIISLTESISHIYDGNRIAIDLYDGSLYMEKNGVYTAIVDKEGQIVRKNIDFINKKDDSLPAFVDDHYIIGKLITESASAVSSYMVKDGELQMVNTLNSNYLITFSPPFGGILTNILRRAITIDVNPSEDIEGIPSAIYNGQLFGIEILMEMADNLVGGHSIASGVRVTADENVSKQGSVIMPKLLTNSMDFVIVDEEGYDVTENYSVIYVDRRVYIMPREIGINITLELSEEQRKKYYDGSLFTVNATTAMAEGIVDGEIIYGGKLVTLDANVYTLDEWGQIIYDSEDNYISKELFISEQESIIIRKKNSQGQYVIDSTSNYLISLTDNFVDILPKPVSVDIRKDYYNLNFVYNATVYEFDVTETMITDIYNAPGLLSSHRVSPLSSPIRAAEVNARDGIDLIYPEGQLYIAHIDDMDNILITHNYDFDYNACQINITKRPVEMNVALTGLDLKHIYDGKIYEIDIVSEMDANKQDLTRGLIENHVFVGKARTVDEFVDTVYKYKRLYCECEIITDETGTEDYTDNYLITFTETYAEILPKEAVINFNYYPQEALTKVYDGQKMTLGILQAMTEDLVLEDFIVEGASYRSTVANAKGVYDLHNQGEGEIVINRAGISDNLAFNYTFIYVGEVTISPRKIFITVRNTDDYYYDEESDFISGLKDVYNEHYTSHVIDYAHYYIDDADNDNNGFGFELVEGHYFAGGSVLPETINAAEKIKLVLNLPAVIRNSASENVTSNYQIEYKDSYYEILKRKIKFDVALNEQGSTDDYQGSFVKTYDRKRYEIILKYYMVKPDGNFLPLVQNHIIYGGCLVTENGEVERDYQGNVIPKPLIWDPQRPLIIHNAEGADVTANYDIDTENTSYNFVERVVTIQPKLLVIDITYGVQTDYTKVYDGQVFTVDIYNTMVIEDYPGSGGFACDYNEDGLPIDKDSIKRFSGTLVTEDANVQIGDGGIVAPKLLKVGSPLVVENPMGEDVTHNYDIRYYKGINSMDDWDLILEGHEEDYAPTVIIQRKQMEFVFLEGKKIQKYYDGEPFDLVFEFQNGILTAQGIYINSDLSQMAQVNGLIQDEKAIFRFTTDTASVNPNIRWVYNPADTVIFNKDGNDSQNNYIISCTLYFAEILKRQICIDVNELGVIEHTYNGELFVIPITDAMALKNAENDHLLLPNESLGLLEGHTIVSGSRRSVSANVGLQNLIPHSQVIIFDTYENKDVTKEYLVTEADDQYVRINPAEVVIALTGERTKVYDGKPFVISLTEEGLVSGLISDRHYIYRGEIVTETKNAGENLPAVCHTDSIVIMQRGLTPEESDIDITFNYYFTYHPATVTIFPKTITISKGADYFKSYNGNTEVVLSPKHYTFGEGDICEGDVVRLLDYTANFSSPEVTGTGEQITVTVHSLDNPNYVLENNVFLITGNITRFSVIVEVEGSIPIENNAGVVFTYDGLPKTATYNVRGLEDVYVKHKVFYYNAQDGSLLSSPPVNAGLYEMILETDDDDYRYWTGAKIMIQINAAPINITFTGDFNQDYGEVIPLSARAVAGGGLDLQLPIEYVPIRSGYSFPEAGEYRVQASFNTDISNKNYQSASSSATLVINKRMIEVEYGNTDNLVYNGKVQNIPVKIKPGYVLPADSLMVTDSSLKITYSGDYSVLKNAGNYVMTVTVENNNYDVINNTKNVVIKKKVLTVRALINGSSRLTINEGEDIIPTIEYTGFVSGEDRSFLQKPAYLPYIAKKPTIDYEALPFGAESINYDFEYVPAYITILERKITSIADENGNAIISGEYSSFANLTVNLVAADISDPVYYQINENINKNLPSKLIEDYKAHMVYRLRLEHSDNEVDSATIRFKLPQNLLKEDTFMVLHLAENGEYKMLGAYKEGEYLVLNADDMGDFVILTPRKGLSPTFTLLLFLAPIALFMIVILFYFMFRRKYDVD